MNTWADKDNDELWIGGGNARGFNAILTADNGHSVSVGLTADQLRELAAEATRLADQAETPEPKFKIGDAVQHVSGTNGIVRQRHSVNDAQIGCLAFIGIWTVSTSIFVAIGFAVYKLF